MAASDLLSDQGIRMDGRRPGELRKIECKLGVLAEADGSAFFQQGNTKILATICGPHEVISRKSKTSPDQAVINCVVKAAPFSTGTRKKVSRNDMRYQSMSNILKSSFEAIILTHTYAGSQIDLCFLVLFVDGGLLSACVNAGTLALIQAGIPIKDYLCGCSSGFVRECPLVDVNHLEGFMGGVEFNCALLPSTNEICMQFAEYYSSKIHHNHKREIRRTAKEGCKDVKEILDAAVKQYASTVFCK